MTELNFTNETMEEVKAMAEAFLEKADNAELAQDKANNEAAIEQCINRYKFLSKTACYAEAKASGDPMSYACTRFFYPVIRLKETRDKDSGIIIRSIIDAESPIDLGDIHKKLGGIGHDTNWIYTAEKFNFYMTARVAKDLNAKLNMDAYQMNKISHERELGVDPCSNSQLLKTLQTIVTEMLGEEYKATSHDVKYIIYVYAKDNRKTKNGVSVANHKTFRGFLQKVCWRILTGSDHYDVESKEIKMK